MRHRINFRKLSRNSSHRKALFRNLVTQLLEHEAIVTTYPKAMEIRSFVDKMITLGKKGDLPSYRKASGFVQSNEITKKLFSDIAPRFLNRNGGYTRVMKIGNRQGDNAPMARIELVTGHKSSPPRPKKPISLKAIKKMAFYESKLREHGHSLPDQVLDWEWRIPQSWADDAGIVNPPSYVCVPFDEQVPDSNVSSKVIDVEAENIYESSGIQVPFQSKDVEKKSSPEM